VRHELRSYADPDALWDAASAFIAERVHLALAANATCHLALSGGRTPRRMFDQLATADLAWRRVVIYQVDERITPDADQRNLTSLTTLGAAGAHIEPMPVTDDDLEGASADYAHRLAQRLDLVHLGLGTDGHTASLVPGDPVLEVSDRLVALTSSYQGYRRMTLTYRALARAEQLLWLVSGERKSRALSQLLGGDTSIPAGRVQAAHSLVLCDQSALARAASTSFAVRERTGTS